MQAQTQEPKSTGLAGKILFMSKKLLPASLPLTLFAFFTTLSLQIVSLIFVVIPQNITQLVNTGEAGVLSFLCFRIEVTNNLGILALIFLGTGISYILLSFLSETSKKHLENKFGKNLRILVHDRLLTLDASYHDRHNAGEYCHFIDNTVGAAAVITTLLIMPAACIITTIVGFQNLALSLKSSAAPTWLVITLIAAMIISPFVRLYLHKYVSKYSMQLQKNFIELRTETLNSLNSPVEIHLLNAIRQRRKIFEKACSLLTLTFNKQNTNSIITEQFNAVCILVFQVVIVFIVMQNTNDKTAASLIGCILIIPQVFQQLTTLFTVYSQVKMASPGINMTYDVLNTESCITDAENAQDIVLQTAPAINCRAVRFGYHQDKPILNDIGVVFLAGKTTAVISLSGGGKSTLLKMLCRIYDPQSGSIAIDHTGIKDITLDSLRSNIVYISQFPCFIQGTVRENFQLQNADVTDEEIEQACKDTEIWNLFSKEPAPLDKVLPFGAENLSGGQRKLLAMARSMLKQPKVLILDEPTTGVDAQTVQHTILPILNRTRRGRTVVLVDHNMNFIRETADYVLVLEKGMIADFGQTEEVWNKEGSLFRKLWEEYNKAPDKAVESVPKTTAQAPAGVAVCSAAAGGIL